MSMSDITNYAYVWYTKDAASQITEEDLEKIYEIILNYSYPCYLSGSEAIRQLTPEQKTNMLQHELLFIKEKMSEAGLNHIIMIQIPRVLYDLFNIYFTFKHTQTDILNFYYECSINIARMTDYNALTRKYTDSVKDRIFALNVFIANYIQEKYSMSSIRDSYDKMADELVAECWLLRDTPPETPQMTPEQIKALAVANTEKESGIHEKEGVVVFKMFNKVSMEEAKNIVRQIIHFEKQDSQGHAILYRGAQNDVDSLIDISENYWSNPPSCDKLMTERSSIPCLSLSFRSLSFNLSIFTGCALDDGACTISYFSQSPTFDKKTLNDKIKFNIKKFLLDDSSSENSLFFIPPIHPYVQLYSSGELFHSRTKIGIDYLDKFKKIKDTTRRFSGEIVKGLFFCTPNEEKFIEQCDYLKSRETHEQLNAIYQRYKSTTVIGTWYSDAARQSKQEQFMQARAATVKEAALRGSTLPENLEIKLIGNRWKKLEAIPGETKFKAIEKYYPELRKRIRFMISNYVSRYLQYMCPKSSVTVSYQINDWVSNHSNVDYPSATIEFESKSDFEECQKKFQQQFLQRLPDLQKGTMTSFLYSGIVQTLFENSRFYLDRDSELYKERDEISMINHNIFDIGMFLSKHLLPHERRDRDIEYKNNLNNYFIYMSEIFPQLQAQWQRGGGKTRRNFKRNRHRKNQFKSKNKIESKPKNKSRTKPKNKTKKNKW